jgi:hypothetical protein
MKKVALFSAFVAVMFMVGCGGAQYAAQPNNPAPTSPSPAARGQWHFGLASAAVPSSGGSIDFDLIDNNISSSHCGETDSNPTANTCFGTANSTPNAVGTQTLSGSFGICTDPSVVVCDPTQAVMLSFTGTLSADGKTLISGTYSGSTNAGQGSLTGFWLPPFSGTYNGLVEGFSLSDEITVTVSQDSNFRLAANGVDVGNGIVATLTLAPNGNCNGCIPTSVIGGTISGEGSFTAPQFLSGTFHVFGQIAGNDESILNIITEGPGGQFESGQLRKQ